VKKILICLLAISIFLPAIPLSAASPDPKAMTFPPLEFKIPKTDRVVLSNDIVVHLLVDHELPMVWMSAYIGVGSVYDPSDKVGLAALTGAAMRNGGVGSVPAEKVDDELEFMASSVEEAILSDTGTASLVCLTKNLDRTLDIFSGMLMKPAFREDRVELVRRKAIEQIRRENDDPKEVAVRELKKALYRGSPLGNHPTVESLGRITRADLIGFHRRFFHPNNMILSVAGDFDRTEMLGKLEKAFGGWRRQGVDFPPVKLPVPAPKGTVYLVRKDISQSVIRMGHLGIDKSNPDMFAVKVMDFILGGGGFESRMMSAVRTAQGLAYNAETNFGIGRRYPGLFTAETETKAESTVKAVRLMEDIITGMTSQRVTDEELRQAKDSIVNSFIFGFTNSSVVASHQAMLEYYGYPKGYLEHYRDNIAKVTAEDVLRVARKYLRPMEMSLMVVGDDRKFDSPLSTIGEVKEINLRDRK
jgi:predicted Zn-dependent peptidase